MTATLKPAKPYKGKAQHQAVRASLKALGQPIIGEYNWRCGWNVSNSTAPARVEFEVANGFEITSAWAPAVRLSVADDRPTEPVLDALREAGWTVEPLPIGTAWVVYGPGFVEYATAEKKREMEYAASRNKARTEAKVRVERLNALLAEHDIKAFVASYGPGEVTLTLAQVEALIESARRSA